MFVLPQDVKNVLVKYSGPRVFYTSLPGSSLLISNFITACESIINSLDIKEVRVPGLFFIYTFLYLQTGKGYHTYYHVTDIPHYLFPIALCFLIQF